MMTYNSGADFLSTKKKTQHCDLFRLEKINRKNCNILTIKMRFPEYSTSITSVTNASSREG